MQKKFSSIVTLLVIILFIVNHSWGAGFALYENSSRGGALCGALAARADDPSALFFNPSGITQLQGRQISNGMNTYTGIVEIHYPGGRESVIDKTWFVPNFYLSQQMTDDIWLGIGAFAPYGLGNKYREDWYGRYNMYHAEISCIEVNPNIAYKFSDSLSFAFGLSTQHFAILSKRKVGLQNVVIEDLVTNKNFSPDNAKLTYINQFAEYFDTLPDIDQEVSVNKFAYRFNISFRFSLNDKISIGANYRSKVSYTLSGDVKYKQLPQKHPLFPQLDSPVNDMNIFFQDSDLEVDISLPDIFAFGVAYAVNDKLIVEADIVHTRWSRYDKLIYHFQNGIGYAEDRANWSNVNCYRLGAEYQLNESLTARFGYLFDESPLDDNYIDFSLPGNERHLFTTGFGFKYNKFIIDGNYGLVICLDRDNMKNLNKNAFIDYEWQHRKSYTHHLGFNVTYVF